MIYKLDGVDISAFEAKPIRTEDHFAVTGIFDLPRRTGDTEYHWGTEIEPFVEKEDIEIDGRRLTLNVILPKGELKSFIDACIECRQLTMQDGWLIKSFDVICKDEIKVLSHNDYRVVEVPFWQETVTVGDVWLNGTATLQSKLAIDEFDMWNDFNVLMTKDNWLFNESKRIDVKTTEFYAKNYFRSTRDIELICFMHTDGLTETFSKMSQLHALMYKPGMRNLKLKNESLDVYFKGGLACKVISDKIIHFTLKATVV